MGSASLTAHVTRGSAIVWLFFLLVLVRLSFMFFGIIFDVVLQHFTIVCPGPINNQRACHSKVDDSSNKCRHANIVAFDVSMNDHVVVQEIQSVKNLQKRLKNMHVQ